MIIFCNQHVSGWPSLIKISTQFSEFSRNCLEGKVYPDYKTNFFFFFLLLGNLSGYTWNPVAWSGLIPFSSSQCRTLWLLFHPVLLCYFWQQKYLFGGLEPQCGSWSLDHDPGRITPMHIPACHSSRPKGGFALGQWPSQVKQAKVRNTDKWNQPASGWWRSRQTCLVW